MQVEEFRVIENFENYSVSNLGRIRNDKKDLILKPRLDKCGYCYINLYNDGKRMTFKIHRVVALAFIPNPDNKKCVDHIDNDKTNNNTDNLRWATIQENGFNRLVNKNNTSGHKGLTFHKKTNKWLARITINKKLINLGYYDKLEDAIESRRKAALEKFGQYINTCERN